MANALTELWKKPAGRWVVGAIVLVILVLILLRAH